MNKTLTRFVFTVALAASMLFATQNNTVTHQSPCSGPGCIYKGDDAKDDLNKTSDAKDDLNKGSGDVKDDLDKQGSDAKDNLNKGNEAKDNLNKGADDAKDDLGKEPSSDAKDNLGTGIL